MNGRTDAVVGLSALTMGLLIVVAWHAPPRQLLSILPPDLQHQYWRQAPASALVARTTEMVNDARREVARQSQVLLGLEAERDDLKRAMDVHIAALGRTRSLLAAALDATAESESRAPQGLVQSKSHLEAVVLSLSDQLDRIDDGILSARRALMEARDRGAEHAAALEAMKLRMRIVELQECAEQMFSASGDQDDSRTATGQVRTMMGEFEQRMRRREAASRGHEASGTSDGVLTGAGRSTVSRSVGAP